ncbi:MAG: DUF4838 domain-containing protein [Planctomycetia bacterium]|nr:DUF4838 domain-containing protein [Planctomycetia bacterium]
MFRPAIFTLFFGCALLITSLSASALAKDLVLIDDGKTRCQIVLPTEATEVQKTTALEVQKYLKQISGAEVPVVTESETEAQNESSRIVIGPSALSQKLLGKSVNEAEIAYDGIVVKTVGSDLVLSGHAQRGMLYSAYTFLEEVLGCRFWTPTCETIPERKCVTVPDNLNIQFAPKLVYRDSYTFEGRHENFAPKVKLNGSVPIPGQLGGNHKFCHFVHSFYPLIPPEKYFAQHPEWYSEVDGKRTYELAQLCLTNEEMTQELIKNVLRDLRANPDATFVSVSQNDWHEKYCRCEKCTKVAEEEGAQSGVLIRFVNKVAEAVEKEFPHVYVETLAYTYTRKPPKLVKPRKNVVVRLCTIECSFSQPLSGEQNVTLREDIDGWAKIAPNLFIWDYVTNFTNYLLPHPNYGVLLDNIQFFIDHNAIGIFEQGDVHSRSGDFVAMRTWIVAKMLWNPERDFDSLKNEFITGYYAPELVPIFDEYFKLLRKEVETSEIYLGIYRNTVRDWLSLRGLNQATKLMDKAEKVARKLEAEQPKRHAGLVNKIRYARMPIDYVWLKEYHHYRMEAWFDQEKWDGPQDFSVAVDEFIAFLDEFKIPLYREWNGNIQDVKDEFLTQKEELSVAKESATPPEFCQKLPRNRWIEIQDGQFRKYQLGKYSFLEKDSAASNGLTVRMGGDHTQWATALSIPTRSGAKESEKPMRIHIYASVRCDATGTEGRAMELGVYDGKQKKTLLHRIANIPEIAGPEYRWIDLGVFDVGPGQYFWTAPINRPADVQNVYTDRVILIQE